jgi:hypothetical protein
MFYVLLAALLGMLPGFAVGLLAFTVKSRWCPRCGGWTWRPPSDTYTGGSR